MASQVHFTRMDPEVRKAHLIDATLVCLKQYGFQGMSVRKICAQAGVSPGLISHHYAGKDELVAEAYQAITRQVMGQLREAMQNAAGQGARERLSAFFQASLSEKLLNPHLLEAWLAFWGAVKTVIISIIASFRWGALGANRQTQSPPPPFATSFGPLPRPADRSRLQNGHFVKTVQLAWASLPWGRNTLLSMDTNRNPAFLTS